MACTGNATALIRTPSPGGDTAGHANVQSILKAAMGLTSLSAPISPSSLSSRASKTKASIISNQSETHPAAAATSALLAIPSPPIYNKSSPGFGNLQAPFAPFLKDATLALDQFSAGGQTAAMKSAAVDVLPSALPSLPRPASQGNSTPPPAPTPASLSSPPPTRDPIEPVPAGPKSFPEILLEVLSSDEHTDAVAWLPHGRGLVLLDKDLFARTILPRYFDGAKYSSFTRRMKRWGFDRIRGGPEMGAYYHPEFRRDRPELVQDMRYGAEVKREEDDKKEKAAKGNGKGKGKEGAVKSKKKPVNKAVLKRLLEKNAERQVQTSLSKKVPVRLNNAARAHVLKSQAEYSPPHFRAEDIIMDTWLPVNTYPQDRDCSIPLPSASPVHAIAHKKAKLDSCAENEHARHAANGRNDATWLENRADLLHRSSFSSRLPDRGALLDLREQRMATIQREMLLTQSMLSCKVGGLGGAAAGVRSRSSAYGRLADQRPYPPTRDFQRAIDVELAARPFTAESVAGLCARRPPPAGGGTDSVDAMMASKVLASSKIHATIMDAVARDLCLRSRPAPPVAIPELSPRQRGDWFAELGGRSFLRR